MRRRVIAPRALSTAPITNAPSGSERVRPGPTGAHTEQPRSLAPVVMQIERHEQFYSSAECALVMGYVTRVERDGLWARAPDAPFWDRRFVHCGSIDDSRVVSLMRSKRAVAKELIRAAYGVKDELYSDLLQIVRWTPGCELRPHADSEEPDGRPHPFPHREFASIIYLNEDFLGGQIYFPRQDDARPIMTPGTLVFFPGSLPFLHGVEEIAAGTRYTIASFYTRDRSKADAYDRAR